MARTPRSAAEKLAMRKKKSRALLLFNIIAFSVVVIGAVLLCIFVFFKVGNVTFTSDAGYDEADIRRVCGINEGDNLVLLETESREKALEHRFPYIESAKIVKQHIPSTIEIEITPAETAFSVACDAGYLYVSASGKVLEIASQPCEGTTVVLGANPTNTKPSETITFGDDSVKEVYNAIAEQMTKNETQNVTEINMTNPYDLTLTYDNRITFRFGNMNGMSYKMAFGLEMLRQMETSGEITEETVGSIDLSVVPEKNKAFYEEDRTAASATPAPGDAAGRTDGTDSTANGDGENGDTANPTGDTDGITDPAADDSGDNTGDSGDNTGDAENV